MYSGDFELSEEILGVFDCGFSPTYNFFNFFQYLFMNLCSMDEADLLALTSILRFLEDRAPKTKNTKIFYKNHILYSNFIL